MKIETKFNIGDRVVIPDDKKIYEVESVAVSVFKCTLTEYKLSHPQGGIWAREHWLSLAPVVVTNAECTHTIVHNLSSVYGVDSVHIPDGYRFKCFAKPKRGDIMISADRVNVNADFKVDCAPWDYQTPRIILEKI